MKRLTFILLLASCLGLSAQERDQTVADLPPAVQKTVDRETHNGEITKKGKEGGKYEISFTRTGMTHRITVNESGAVTEYKDEILIDTLPSPARNAILADAAGGELMYVSRYVRSKDVIYRSAVMKNGKKVGIQVTPDGTPVQDGEGRRLMQKK